MPEVSKVLNFENFESEKFWKFWISKLFKFRKFWILKFTGEYRSVAIIPTLFWDHRQKSKKANFSSFFRLLTVIPKKLCNDSNDMVIPGKFHPKKLYE